MSQYDPPPGPPPPAPHYAAPPGAPPPSRPAPAPDTSDTPTPSEPLPPYTEEPTSADLPIPSPSVKFITIPIHNPGPAHSPLDPPPECFSTPSPFRIRAHSFDAFRIPSVGASLATGFQPLYAPDLLGPHGISQDDWARFLLDLSITSHLAAQGRSAIAPNRGPGGPRVLSVLGGPRAAAGGPYDQAFARTPVEEVKALIDVWNGSAFERRRLKVSLHDRTDTSGTHRQGYELFVEAL